MKMHYNLMRCLYFVLELIVINAQDVHCYAVVHHISITNDITWVTKYAFTLEMLKNLN